MLIKAIESLSGRIMHIFMLHYNIISQTQMTFSHLLLWLQWKMKKKHEEANQKGKKISNAFSFKDWKNPQKPNQMNHEITLIIFQLLYCLCLCHEGFSPHELYLSLIMHSAFHHLLTSHRLSRRRMCHCESYTGSNKVRTAIGRINFS